MNQPPAEPPPGAGPTGLSLPDPDASDDGPERVPPTDAELFDLWPDPFAGPPDDRDAWLAGLSVAEHDAIFGLGADEEPDAVGAGFAAGGPLEELPPGPVLAVLSQDVLDAGLGQLSDDELVGVLRAARRLSSWQAAVEFAAVGELDARRQRAAARPGWSRTSEHVSEELATALTLTGRSADSLLCLARDLMRLPMVLAALAAGRIDRARAAVFASELAALGDIAAAAVAAAYCGIAGSMTTGQLRAALRAMVLSVDPDALRRRAEKGRADTRVETWREGSGNTGLAGRELPSSEAIVADRRIAAIARALKEAGTPGTMDQLRSAVFVALLTGRDPESLLPAPTGPAAPTWPAAPTGPARPGSGLAGLAGSVNLTMPLATWLGRSETAGEIAGLGPLDAETCRDLAARLGTGPGARWCLTVTDRDGRAVGHACARAGPGPPASCRAWLDSLEFSWLERGTCAHAREIQGYRPGNILRTLVKVRQRTCAFPGCRRPATACDDDHTTPYDQGGRTCECNLAPLCRRHHRAKQAPGWKLSQPEPGLLVWTAPHGRSYRVTPDPYPV